MTLKEANSVGLIFDYESHELKWRNEEERIGYEIRTGKSCKGGQQIEDEIRKE